MGIVDSIALQNLHRYSWEKYFDNLYSLRNAYDRVELKDLKHCFLNLYQEKAFDRADWLFIFKCLERFNFGPDFCKWVKLVYSFICSSVTVNGHISEKYSLNQGVRREYSLSTLLYLLCLEQ